MAFCVERDTLEAELARMPLGAGGRTVQGRRRKMEVEARLDELKATIGRLNLELRN